MEGKVNVPLSLRVRASGAPAPARYSTNSAPSTRSPCGSCTVPCNGVWAVSGRILARYPIDCLAPYVFVAGGVQADGETVGTIGTGGGLEYRVSEKLGIFGEGRYTWAENDGNNTQYRLGVRVVF